LWRLQFLGQVPGDGVVGAHVTSNLRSMSGMRGSWRWVKTQVGRSSDPTGELLPRRVVLVALDDEEPVEGVVLIGDEAVERGGGEVLHLGVQRVHGST
jgi:hypothetical protein